MKVHQLFFLRIVSLAYLISAENDAGRQGSIRRQAAATEMTPEGLPGPYIGGDKVSTKIDQTGESAVLPSFAENSKSMRYEIMYREGASYTTVHFSEFNLEDGCVMIVSGKDLPDGTNQEYVMTGKGKMGLGTFWTQHVKGDTMYIDVQCSEESIHVIVDGHFVVDEVALGFTEGQQDDAGLNLKALCGTSDFENAMCYSSKTAYTKARAVARLLINGDAFCTGWLVSGSNYLVTCDHCISSQSEANNVDFEFAAEAPSCSTSNCKNCHAGVAFSGATYISSSSSVDYSLLKITSGNPAATYGYLELDNRVPPVGEQVYIPQHPRGRAKEFGVISTHAQDSGVCQIKSTSESGCTSSNNDYGYYCDTEGGSSGSPVLSASSNKVLALHHCAGNSACSQSGGDPNRGIPITRIYDSIKCALDDTCVATAPSPTGGSPTAAPNCNFATTFKDGLSNLAEVRDRLWNRTTGNFRDLFP